ncbi:protein of unknown function [Desulfotomaculum arcticum]|uniref:UPF0291 protein SAMN05660649_04960 n=1 Tax=Desulfotruncus arcticus DSM 17038 TaxID=1121424 RepID=A0A1I2ZIU1_9FIRM|nr:DUF896 domain-containing protein [Desulfotruncus arcticus]SFH37650.1 protein of unknown function [Desulfotomaculum arcticum] [Desulfotruncus arcticus DSM 17038]
MTSMELVNRINYLARKERYEGLTAEEKEEQQKLRRQYLDSIRQQMIDALEGAGYEKKHDTHCRCHKRKGDTPPL